MQLFSSICMTHSTKITSQADFNIFLELTNILVYSFVLLLSLSNKAHQFVYVAKIASFLLVIY